MKKIIFTIFTFLIILSVSAQQYTLTQSVEYAVSNLENLKNLDIDRQLAEKKLKEAYTQLYPQIKGVFDVRDNLKLPTSILPGTFAGRPADETIPVQIGQKYNATVALDASWTLYDPTFYAGFKSVKLNSTVAENNKELQTINVRLNVSKAYYATLLSKERIILAEKNISKTKKVYDDTKVLYDNKQVQETDVTRAQLNYANQEAELKRAKQLYDQSIFILKYQMGYPSDQALTPTDTLLLRAVGANSVQSSEAGMENRMEYKTLQLQKNQESLGLKKNKLAYLPTVSVYGYLGTQSFRPKFDMFTSSSAKWYGVSYLGLKLSLPIFDGNLKGIYLQESKLQVKKKENELSAFEKQYKYEVENARLNVENSISNVNIRKNNVEIGEKLLKITEARYNDGLMTYKDVNEAQASLTEAQTSYYNSLYDYISAKLDYDKVVNQLK
jgi:outer membrane protein